MKYKVEVWKYEGQEDRLKEFSDFLFKNKEIMVITDATNNDTFVIAGKRPYKKGDRIQADIIAKALNEKL